MRPELKTAPDSYTHRTERGAEYEQPRNVFEEHDGCQRILGQLIPFDSPAAGSNGYRADYALRTTLRILGDDVASWDTGEEAYRALQGYYERLNPPAPARWLVNTLHQALGTAIDFSRRDGISDAARDVLLQQLEHAADLVREMRDAS